MSETRPAYIRWLPTTETVMRPAAPTGACATEGWFGFTDDARPVMLYPGWIDVRTYPELEPYTLPDQPADRPFRLIEP